MVLTMLGGSIGIGLGCVNSSLVARFAASGSTRITPAIGLDTALMATLFSMFIGLFFDVYPASLEPVETLRYE